MLERNFAASLEAEMPAVSFAFKKQYSFLFSYMCKTIAVIGFTMEIQTKGGVIVVRKAP